MMDVEKYGVVGLLFVAGILGLVLFFGPDEDPDTAGTELKTEAAAALRGNAGAQPAPRPGTRSGSGGGSRVEFADGPARSAPRRSAEAIVYDMAPPIDAVSAPRFDFANDAPAFASGVPVSATGRCTYVIQSGDILGKIAERILGKAIYAKDLLAWNPGLDPRALRVDQVIRVCPPGRDAPPSEPASASPAAAKTPTSQPAPKPSSTPAANSARTYTVKSGDVLSAIAEKQLGSVQHTDALFQANRHLMSSPDQLALGMVLKLPKVGKLADG